MYICDKAIKDSKNTVNIQSRGTVASGVKEGPGGGCARPRGPSTPLAGHGPGLSEISSLSPAPPAACGPCRSCVLLWEFVTSQEASEVPGPAPLPAPVRRGCTARVLQGAPPPGPLPAFTLPPACHFASFSRRLGRPHRGWHFPWAPWVTNSEL